MKIVNSKYKKLPCWQSGRIWLQKLGHYKLSKKREKVNDWVWMVDHLVQAGHLKCLVILGIRRADIPKGRPLRKSDLEPLLIKPMEESNMLLIASELEKLKDSIGLPQAIIADHGSDIKSGIEYFCLDKPDTIYLYDIKHLIASVLRKFFDKNEIWQSFLDFAASSKKYLQQTKLSGLAPPNQRNKARYMNIEPMINWGRKLLNFLNNENYPTNVDEEVLKRKLGWLEFFRDDLRTWKQQLDLALSAEKYIRKHGYSWHEEKKVLKQLPQVDDTEYLAIFKHYLINKISIECKKAIGYGYPSSTEALESLFGSFKYLEKEQSRSGFTSLTLAMAAFVGKTNKSDVMAAMEDIKVSDINEWKQKLIGESVQSQRTAWLNSKLEQKCYEKIAA